MTVQELVCSGSCGQIGIAAVDFASMARRDRFVAAEDSRHPQRFAFGRLRGVEGLAKRDCWRPENRYNGYDHFCLSTKLRKN